MPDNVTLDPPITNIERLLAIAAGMEGVSVDEPETRIERYLKAICDRLDSIGERFVATLSYDDTTETWSSDKTFEECISAWEAGQNLFVLADGTYVPVSLVVTTDGDVTFISFSVVDAETHSIAGFGIDADGVYYNH